MSEELTLQQLRLLGGKATLKKYGKDHYKNMAQKSLAAKKQKKESSEKPTK